MNAQLSRLGLFVAGALLASHASAAPSYTFTDLGNGIARVINNAGQVAGNFNNNATMWTVNGNGVTTTILGAGGAAAINNAGDVAGYSSNDDGGYNATVWTTTGSGTKATSLGAGFAYGINDAGQVAGNAKNSNGRTAATVWNGGTTTDLGASAKLSYASAINNAGQVAGVSFDSNYNQSVTVWNSTTATILGVTTLASNPYGPNFTVSAINDGGQVAGHSTSSDAIPIATIWSGATATSLSSFYSLAYDLNNAGDMVGLSYNRQWKGGATLWTMTEGVYSMIDIDSFLSASEIDAGWHLTAAYGINDSGSIVGQSQNTKTGAQHAFLLTANPSESAVPEPATCATLLAGLGLMGFMRRRRKS